MIEKSEIQVLIIGAGAKGTVISGKLSWYKLDVLLVEKDLDVASGQIKCNAGIVYSPLVRNWV